MTGKNNMFNNQQYLSRKEDQIIDTFENSKQYSPKKLDAFYRERDKISAEIKKLQLRIISIEIAIMAADSRDSKESDRNYDQLHSINTFL